MPLDLKQAMRNRAWQPPTPDQEALQEPLIAPETYGAGSVLKKAMAGLAGGGAMLGQTVYHGSPHVFDKFDINKVGAGQGAQTYGHGLYMAENPAVAKVYAEDLGIRSAERMAMDHADEGDIAGSVDSLFSEITHGPQRRLLEALRNDGWLGYDYPHQALHALRMENRGGMSSHDPSQATIDAVTGLQNLYKVDLPDSSIKRMLNWDTPLYEQPDVTSAMLRPVRPVNKPTKDALWKSAGSSLSGRESYRSLADSLWRRDNPAWANNPIAAGPGVPHPTEGGAKSASEALNRAAGIPGIKFSDQGSRGIPGGTSNYVVFDDSLPKILERSNVPSRLMGRR